MITHQEFKNMQTASRCLIEIIFEYGEQFKADFITPFCNYSSDDYELERVHMSGSNLRVQLRFDDNSKVDIYRDLTEVIQWYYNLAEKVFNK